MDSLMKYEKKNRIWIFLVKTNLENLRPFITKGPPILLYDNERFSF